MSQKFDSMTDAVIDLQKAMTKASKNAPEMWEEVGKTVVQNMKVAQAQGKGSPSHDSGYQKFDDLAISTIRQRRREKLSNLTKPTKSNLIESGKMHSDLISVSSKEDVLITHSTQRSREIASYHEEGNSNMPARKFMHLGKVNTKTVKNIILKFLDKYLKGR